MTDTLPDPPDAAPADAPPTDPVASFVGYVLHLAGRTDGDARRRLAELRRAGMEAGRSHRALAIVGDRIPEEAQGWDLDAYLLAAELMALVAAGGREIGEFHAETRRFRRSTLGASARSVNPRKPNADGDLADENKGITARFGAVLALPSEDLPDELRRLVRLLHQKGAPFDFVRLLRDLLRWDDPDQPVQKEWARHYWSAPRSDDSDT